MIEAVIVSVGYGDLLSETLPANIPLLDHIVVVTSPADKETIGVCRKHSVHCIQSEDHTRGGKFNKARMIQRGLDQIGGGDWIAHIDADVVLPLKFRQMVDWAHLDPKVIYGADRQDVVGWDNWQRLKQHAGAWDNHGHGCAHWWHPHFDPGSRWVSNLHGYVPIGFFQLFNGSETTPQGYHQKRYQYHHGDAARSDVQFALQWDRRNRQVLPEVIVLHLSSEQGPIGVNWEGRKTKRFGPEAIQDAARHRPPSHPHCPPPHRHPDPPRHRHDA